MDVYEELGQALPVPRSMLWRMDRMAMLRVAGSYVKLRTVMKELVRSHVDEMPTAGGRGSRSRLQA